jgi:hypothetical protein
MIYKIYGERNSGTNFLEKILKINFNITIQQNEWKHSIPLKKEDDSTEFIIIRELPKWLSSMYSSPYHLNRHKNFTDFLMLPQSVSEGEKDEHTVDNNKTIFDIRYSKYNGMMRHFNTYRRVCIVNLDYIQKDVNCNYFLKSINSIYKLNKTTPYITNCLHTKDNSTYKNRNTIIKSNDYLSIINSNLNDKIEHEIEALTFKIKE